MTFIAALRCDRIDAPDVLDAPINALTFTAWIEQCLVPTLAPGDVVCSIISAATKAKLSARQSGPPEPSSSSCHPTRPTSTPSSRSSQRLS
jgi:hypothetical protein